jgi:hypothetical protein
MPRKSNKNGGYSKPIKEAPSEYFRMNDFVEKSKKIKPKEVFGTNYKEDKSKKNNIKKK